MSVSVKLPTALRPFAGQQDSIVVDGKTAGEVLQALFSQHEGLKKQLLTPDGKMRNFVNVYVNEDDTRDLKGLNTPVKDGDTVLIVPAIAGGSGEAALTKEELQRYHRHLIMPEVGPEGQKRIKNARVLCIGAGGLGSPATLYLAAAGVGTIGLVDFDVVDQSNLQRQVLYTTQDVGQKKLQVAKKRLQALNPNVNVGKL
jgi:sulfur-carrier protein adenylyltransferase/sulfurtransferase